MVMVDLVAGESPLPGLQTAIVSLCLHTAERERGSKLSHGFL